MVQELFNIREKNLAKKENDEKYKVSVKNNLNEIENMIECIIEHFLDLDNYCRSLGETGCMNIKRYMLNVVVYYQNQLMKILKNEFDLILKSVSYPYNKEIAQQNVFNQTKAPGSTSNSERVDIRNYSCITEVNEGRLRSCVNRLLKIETFKSKSFLMDDEKINNNQRITSIVIVLLIKPLEKRFKYHFFGSRKTNNLEKVKLHKTKNALILPYFPFKKDYLQLE